jgi:hypothetical protein
MQVDKKERTDFMKDVYVDIRGLDIYDLFDNRDFVNVEELVDMLSGIYLDNKNKEDEINELREFKNNICNEVMKNPYSYYGISESDFH